MQKTPVGDERAAYFRSLELEQTRRQLDRTKAAFNELKLLYEDLMDSGAFLYSVVALDGAILSMNMGMKVFLGRDAPDSSIFEFCLFSQMDALKGLLHDALNGPVAALVPLIRGTGTQVWMEAEFAPTEMNGHAVVQLTGYDVSEWMGQKAKDSSSEDGDTDTQSKVPVQIERHGGEWTHILDSCPGLLCCVINHVGRLLYASQGYRAIAMRLLGHDCVTGQHYPPMYSETDHALHSLLSGVMLGATDGIEVSEHRGDPNDPNDQSEVIWNFTAAPLKIGNVISGAVLYVSRNDLTQTDEAEAHDDEEDTGAYIGEAILDALTVRAVVVDTQGVCLAANEPFVQSLQVQKPSGINKLEAINIKGKKFAELIPNDTANETFHRNFNFALEKGSKIKLECRLADSRGELVWLELYHRPITWNEEQAILFTCNDVTELHRTREQLKRALEVDRTTGILNRQGMERLLTQEVERVIREYKSSGLASYLSLITLDIDGFRRINAEHGYTATDRALKSLTEALRNVLSENSPDPTSGANAIGRWGGDEFMVLTYRSGPDAQTLADLLREHVKANSELKLTLSVGVAEFGIEADMDVAGFVAAAFDAMIAAKRNGGNRTVLASASKTLRQEAGV